MMPVQRRMTIKPLICLTAVVLALLTVAGGLVYWKQSSNEAVQAEWRMLGHADCVLDLEFSPDGSTLASCSRDSSVKLWNAANGSLLRTLAGHSGSVPRLAFAPDGRCVASGGEDGTIRVWSVKTGQLVARLSGHTTEITAISYAPDGRTLVSAGGYGGVLMPVDEFGRFPAHSPVPKGMARVWDVDGPVSSEELEQGVHIGGFAFAPDGRTLAGVSLGGRITLWDMATRKPLNSVQDANNGLLHSVTFFADGKRLLCAGWRNATVRDGTDLETVAVIEAHSRTDGAALSPDNQMLVTCGVHDQFSRQPHGEFKLWDIASSKSLAMQEHVQAPISCITFSPNGQDVAVADTDGVIQVWKAAKLLKNRTRAELRSGE